MDATWRDEHSGRTEMDQLVYLSNLIGRDLSLAQPGGGNTSMKGQAADVFGSTVPTLVVKGSGTDLSTISARGFTHLYLDRLALLRDKTAISDSEMMTLMRASMLFPDRDPVPSVETPLHSLLPFRFVAHTHDIATLSLSDTPHARENVERVFGDSVAFLPYARPGFPLARQLSKMLQEAPLGVRARALVLEKHGLAAWGETARECYENLRAVTGRAEEFVRQQAGDVRGFAPRPDVEDGEAVDVAISLLPALRGALAGDGWSPVLSVDTTPETRAAVSGAGFAELAARGVMTPEHILRAGRTPLVLELDQQLGRDDVQRSTVEQVTAFRERYQAEVLQHGQTAPIADFLKTVVVPGVGAVYAGKDKRNAKVASECYSATMQVMAGAEAVESFESISAAAAIEMEYWPLERRKIEESAKSRRELDGRIAVVIGAASGIGRTTARRFAEEGAHVVLADIDEPGGQSLADEINGAMPDRSVAVRADVSDAESVRELFRSTVLEFGGVDVLFYSPGVGPRHYSVVEMPDEEIEQKMAIHFQGAVRATKEAAKIMREQGRGGRLVYNASKAAFATGEGFAAYGASKAALVHYARNVANELGRDGITANYINADAVDTPLFRNLMHERAERQGKTEAEMLRAYEERSVLRTATVPPEAVAEAALFLASDRSSYTTGCVITVGGGAESFPR